MTYAKNIRPWKYPKHRKTISISFNRFRWFSLRFVRLGCPARPVCFRCSRGGQETDRDVWHMFYGTLHSCCCFFLLFIFVLSFVHSNLFYRYATASGSLYLIHLNWSRSSPAFPLLSYGYFHFHLKFIWQWLCVKDSNINDCEIESGSLGIAAAWNDWFNSVDGRTQYTTEGTHTHTH